jgi:release factor glutamine methyltransferase
VPETSSLDIRGAFRTGIARLREADVPSYTLAAELLLLHVLQKDRTYLYAHPEEIIPPQQLASYLSLIARRAAGEPTQHLTGKQEFWGLDFAVNPDVLIPRPETEHLLEVALDRLALRERRAERPQKTNGDGFLIADIGTGSGCLAIVLAKEFFGAQIYATDISPAALAVANRNATYHGVHHRIHFLESDLAKPIDAGAAITPAELASKFDLVVSNPPYIPRRDAATLSREVRDHEPAIALYGGEEGYELYAGLIALAAHHLKPGGLLVAELGHDSLPAVQPLLDSENWRAVGVTNDLAGVPRVIAAERTDKI